MHARIPNANEFSIELKRFYFHVMTSFFAIGVDINYSGVRIQLFFVLRTIFHFSKAKNTFNSLIN